TNNWVAQPASDWAFQFANGANLKNADCNGDGIISNVDTVAISLNYGLTHPLRLSNPGSASLPGPPLYVVATPDTVLEGDTVQVAIFLGTTQIPIDSIYGLAFTLTFDSTLIDTTYMPFDYSTGWMGIQNVDLLTFEKKFLAQGRVDVAITRTDLLNVAGSGIVLTTGVVIIDNIGARLSAAPPFVTLPISISNVRAVTASEYYFSLTTQGDNVEIDTLGSTGLHEILIAADDFIVYPNPGLETINIYSASHEIIKLELSDKLGVVRHTSYPGTNKFKFDTHTLPSGIYLLEITTSKSVMVKKVVIAHK
ncbi:MAG: T9SS type A sorting domain-containing protein, partial [Bacteroidota bacterium]|nr:T9SS type A sorting domain-containing protein [Bacteroidota bacterium]